MANLPKALEKISQARSLVAYANFELSFDKWADEKKATNILKKLEEVLDLVGEVENDLSKLNEKHDV